MTQPPSARAQRMAEAIAAWSLRRVRLPDLWRLLDDADPATRTDVRRRRILSETLDELAAEGLVELPAARSYDRSEEPPLPRFVTLRSPTSVSRHRSLVVWHPALAWVPGARPGRSQLDLLEKVNRWLHTNRDHMIVPMRERSLEIFGSEKVLDRLVGTALFGPGRLTLETLRCHRVVPRFHAEPVGEGDLLLVVENSDTFDSLLTVLRDRTDHRVGLVGWGAGTGFEASVLSIRRLDRHIVEVRYFGDIDEVGLRIPASAAALAATHRLPPIRPANALYDALLRIGIPQSGQRKVTAETAAELTGWLKPEQRDTIGTLLRTGRRIAQEAIGLAYLSRDAIWRRDLT